MLKTILSLNGVELLSKNQLKNISGKGQNGPQIQPKCADGNWAPPGSSSANYPNYPCIHIEGPVPCLPLFLVDGTIIEC